MICWHLDTKAELYLLIISFKIIFYIYCMYRIIPRLTYNLKQKVPFHLSCRSIKSVMKLHDMRDRYWTWLLNEPYVSPNLSEWGYVSFKIFRDNSLTHFFFLCQRHLFDVWPWIRDVTLSEDPQYWKQLITDFTHVTLIGCRCFKDCM